MSADQHPASKQSHRWYQPTPGRLLFLLLPAEGILLLLNWLEQTPKGWAVLIAIASVGGMLLLLHCWFVLAFLFRWRFQYSLRSLMVLMVAVALPFSWLAVEKKWAMQQKKTAEALALITGEGGIEYDSGLLIADGNRRYKYIPSCPEWLRNVFGDDFFGNLDFISLFNSKVTDVELENLEALKQLHYVSLSQTQITDAGLKHLQQLNKLDMLSLQSTKISDAGLKNLGGLDKLQDLDLDNTHITDAGLEHLKGLKQLLYLNLWNTQVTHAGVAKLQKALPNCKIQY